MLVPCGGGTGGPGKRRCLGPDTTRPRPPAFEGRKLAQDHEKIRTREEDSTANLCTEETRGPGKEGAGTRDLRRRWSRCRGRVGETELDRLPKWLPSVLHRILHLVFCTESFQEHIRVSRFSSYSSGVRRRFRPLAHPSAMSVIRTRPECVSVCARARACACACVRMVPFAVYLRPHRPATTHSRACSIRKVPN